MNLLLEQEYRISKTTLAMKQAFHLKYQTVIYDLNGTYYSTKTMTELLEEACLRGGSKMAGRIEAAKYTLGIRNKIPLMIDPFHLIYAYPTHSPQHIQNAWIFLCHNAEIQPHPENSKQTKILFRNKQYLIVDCSYATAAAQKAKTTQLCYEYSFAPRMDGPEDPVFV